VFGEEILGPPLPLVVERMVLALKQGFPGLPATKTATVMAGFGIDVDTETVLALHDSYGLSRYLRRVAAAADFGEWNRRWMRLAQLRPRPPRKEALFMQTPRHHCSSFPARKPAHGRSIGRLRGCRLILLCHIIFAARACNYIRAVI